MSRRAGDEEGRRSLLRRGASATGRVVLGDQRRIGLWILPFMLIVTLTGAVLAAGVTVLVYAQRVEALREEVGGAATAADAAVAEIEGLVEAYSRELGLSSDGEVDPDRATADRGPNAAGVFAIEAGGRVGNAFSFFSDDATTFMVTSAAVVGGADRADVHLPGGVVSGEVLDRHLEWDMATLRIDVGGIAPLPWRPPLEAVLPGARARVLGVAGPNAPVEIIGTVVGVGAEALLLDAPVSSFLRGAPLLDAGGAVIGMVSEAHAPYGDLSGDLRYLPPIRAVCLELVACAPEDLGGRAPIVPAPSLAPAPTARGSQETSPAPAPEPAPQPAPPPPAVPTAEPTAESSPQPTQPSSAEPTPAQPGGQPGDQPTAAPPEPPSG